MGIAVPPAARVTGCADAKCAAMDPLHFLPCVSKSQGGSWHAQMQGVPHRPAPFDNSNEGSMGVRTAARAPTCLAFRLELTCLNESSCTAERRTDE